MILQISDVLAPAVVASIRHSLQSDEASFASGKATAGWYAKDIKHNDQSQGTAATSAIEQAKSALLSHGLFLSAARPKQFPKILVSRYRQGMHYGSHVDDALMGGVRTDLSFTLFLTPPDDYDGGALVIESPDGDSEVKLAAGSVVLYPTTSLHRVSEVTKGERLAIVGWVRSFIRNAEQREALFDLDQVVAHLHANKADRPVMNHVVKVRNSLTRMWAED